MRIKTFMQACFALAFSSLLAACAPGLATDTISPQGYITNAASSDSFEIASSKLALQRSQNADIRAFAQEMIDDHMMSGEMLARTIRDNNLPFTMPQPGQMLAPQRHNLTKLENASAQDFDRMYVKAQIAAHNTAIELHQNYTDNGGNTRLADYAGKTLPTIQMHRNMAYRLMDELNTGVRHAWPFSYHDLMIWQD